MSVGDAAQYEKGSVQDGGARSSVWLTKVNPVIHGRILRNELSPDILVLQETDTNRVDTLPGRSFVSLFVIRTEQDPYNEMYVH